MKRRILGGLLFLWMAGIFLASHQTGVESTEISDSVAEGVQSLFSGEFPMESLTYLVRKSAHLALYAVGGMMALGFLETYPLSPGKQAGYALAFVVFYAASDEYHQTFIEGRSGQASDVLLDSIGAVLGVILLLLWERRREGKCWSKRGRPRTP